MEIDFFHESPPNLSANIITEGVYQVSFSPVDIKLVDPNTHQPNILLLNDEVMTYNDDIQLVPDLQSNNYLTMQNFDNNVPVSNSSLNTYMAQPGYSGQLYYIQYCPPSNPYCIGQQVSAQSLHAAYNGAYLSQPMDCRRVYNQEICDTGVLMSLNGTHYAPLDCRAPFPVQSLDQISQLPTLQIPNFNNFGQPTSASQRKNKEFRCPYEGCTLIIKRKDDLTRHIRTHSGEKPFACSTCAKAFSRKDHLRSHERTHTKERPYKCTICNKGFARSDERKRHSKIHFKPSKESMDDSPVPLPSDPSLLSQTTIPTSPT